LARDIGSLYGKEKAVGSSIAILGELEAVNLSLTKRRAQTEKLRTRLKITYHIGQFSISVKVLLALFSVRHDQSHTFIKDNLVTENNNLKAF
jgi:hypothetical protein